MRFFRYTTTEYTCTKHCGYRRSVVGANMSLFHLIAAGVATLPLWLFSLHEEFPWHYFVSIFAGEVLLVFAAGFLSGFLLMPFDLPGTAMCKQCQAPMFFAGRHFDPEGSPKPHGSDIVICVVFLALNVVAWTALLQGNL